MTLSKMDLIVTLGSVIILKCSYTEFCVFNCYTAWRFYCYADCRYIESQIFYAECHYIEWRNAMCHIFILMQKVVILSVDKITAI
jgi:hypothetical protein